MPSRALPAQEETAVPGPCQALACRLTDMTQPGGLARHPPPASPLTNSHLVLNRFRARQILSSTPNPAQHRPATTTRNPPPPSLSFPLLRQPTSTPLPPPALLTPLESSTKRTPSYGNRHRQPRSQSRSLSRGCLACRAALFLVEFRPFQHKQHERRPSSLLIPPPCVLL